MKEQLLSTLQNSQNYTIAVAEAMPETDYNFMPTDSVWTFGELINHIAYGISWWTDNYIKKVETPWDPWPAKNSKDEAISDLNRAYDAVRDIIKNHHAGDEQRSGFHATLDHITHHRGQAVTYLRCKGIMPPEYTY